MKQPSAWARELAGAIVVTGLLALASACGGGGSGGSGGTGSGAGGTHTGGGGSGGGVPSTCPGRLEALDTSVDAHTVGSGTPASCTESALRAAVDAVRTAGGGSVVFDCGGPHTITLGAQLEVGSAPDRQVIVDGGGVITLSGGGQTRVFDLANHTNFVVQRITIADGFVAAGEPEEDNTPPNSGAAIRHPWFGTLKVIDARFENNECESLDGEIGGGAIFAGGLTEATLSGAVLVNNRASNGGGILNRGSNLTIVDCTFQGNAARSTGDGQFGNGGGVYIDGMNYENPGGDLTVCGTVFADNTAMTHGSGMFAYFYPGSASFIHDCVFDGNRFTNGGKGSGALYHEAAPLSLSGTTFARASGGEHAGAIFLGQGSEATIENCTFADNEVSGNGAGLFNGAAVAHFVHCTFSGNEADYGPAVFKGQSATVTLKNTIFASNTTKNQYSATSCHEAMTDLGGNLQWPATKNNGNPDPPCVEGITFADPKLLPLADNGGFSPTFALGAGSAAQGLATDCAATDQRGVPRSSPCDSGAFEAGP